jgi:hypothetical protein
MATSDLLYVYGICALPPSSLPPLPLGLEGELQWVTEGNIAAIVEPGIDLEGLQADDPRLLTAVLSHDRVLCELFQLMPLLPLRFGTQLTSMEALTAHLLEQQATYEAKLQALAGKAEYQIKLTPTAITLPPLPEGLQGRDYFLAKKQRLQAQTTAQDQQQTQLQALLEEVHQAYGPGVEAGSSTGEAKVYVLVEQNRAPDLQQWLAQAQGQVPHWEISLSPPLPPYHFV